MLFRDTPTEVTTIVDVYPFFVYVLDADIRIQDIYEEWVHINDGGHLSGGITKKQNDRRGVRN